jgi:uncharacterized membrane protein
MKKIILLPIATIATLLFSSCAAPTNAQHKAGVGAAIGGAAGAIIGKQSGNTGKGAAAGALIGGVIGHGVGSSEDKRNTQSNY